MSLSNEPPAAINGHGCFGTTPQKCETLKPRAVSAVATVTNTLPIPAATIGVATAAVAATVGWWSL